MNGKRLSYDCIKRLNESALNIRIGQVFKIDGRKYTVKKIYPFWVMFEDKQGRKLTMTNGEIIVYRTSGLQAKDDTLRRIVCLSNGKTYNSIDELSKEIRVDRKTIEERINEGREIRKRLYEWA